MRLRRDPAGLYDLDAHHPVSLTAAPALSAVPGLLGAVTGIGKLGTGLLPTTTSGREEPR